MMPAEIAASLADSIDSPENQEQLRQLMLALDTTIANKARSFDIKLLLSKTVIKHLKSLKYKVKYYYNGRNLGTFSSADEGYIIKF